MHCQAVFLSCEHGRTHSHTPRWPGHCTPGHAVQPITPGPSVARLVSARDNAGLNLAQEGTLPSGDTIHKPGGGGVCTATAGSAQPLFHCRLVCAVKGAPPREQRKCSNLVTQHRGRVSFPTQCHVPRANVLLSCCMSSGAVGLSTPHPANTGAGDAL